MILSSGLFNTDINNIVMSLYRMLNNPGLFENGCKKSQSEWCIFDENSGFRRKFRWEGGCFVEGSADGAGSTDENVVAGSALRASPRDLVSFAFASVC